MFWANPQEAGRGQRGDRWIFSAVCVCLSQGCLRLLVHQSRAPRAILLNLLTFFLSINLFTLSTLLTVCVYVTTDEVGAFSDSCPRKKKKKESLGREERFEELSLFK